MPLVINLIWDSAAQAAPQSFRDDVQAGADALEAAITNNITVNIEVGYGEVDNGTFILPTDTSEEGSAIKETSMPGLMKHIRT